MRSLWDSCYESLERTGCSESEAPWLPRLMRGIAMAPMMAMITTTITNSIKLKPLFRFLVLIFFLP